MTTRILKGNGNIAKGIALFTSEIGKVNDRVHSLALSIAYHAAPVAAGGFGHGDCTQALTLTEAMPKSMRRDALVAWFTAYTPIRVNLSNGAVGFSDKYMKLDAGKKAEAWKLAAADADPFYASIAEKKDAKAIAFDLAYAIKLLGSTLARIESLAKADGVNDNTKNDALKLVGDVQARLIAKPIAGVAIAGVAIAGVAPKKEVAARKAA